MLQYHELLPTPTQSPAPMVILIGQPFKTCFCTMTSSDLGSHAGDGIDLILQDLKIANTIGAIIILLPFT